MGMFDDFYAVKIDNPLFEHNGHYFQSKDLDCELNKYIIFDDCLYQTVDGKTDESFAPSKKVSYTGAINIYTNDKHEGYAEYWLDYDLTFEDGIIVDVANNSFKSKDLRDLSMLKHTNHEGAHMDVRFSGAKLQQRFMDNQQAIQDALRRVIGDDTATISYVGESGRVIHSVVQKLPDFGKEGVDEAAPTDTPKDILMVMDEFSNLGRSIEMPSDGEKK